MPSSRVETRLNDILANVTRIERFIIGMDQARFERDDKTVFATLHALLIISEAARKLGDQAETLMPDQPWAGIRAIGNVLRHDYDDVDSAAIWRVVASDDPASLRQAVTEALARKGLPS